MLTYLVLISFINVKTAVLRYFRLQYSEFCGQRRLASLALLRELRRKSWLHVTYSTNSVGLQQLDYWNRGFESRWRHGCSSVVFVVCCVGSGLCDGLITRSEESYGVRVCLILRDLGTSTMSRPRPDLGCCATEEKNLQITLNFFQWAIFLSLSLEHHWCDQVEKEDWIEGAWDTYGVEGKRIHSFGVETWRKKTTMQT